MQKQFVKLPSRSRGALATRQGTIMVAVLAAIAALAILLVFLHNYRNSVSGGGEPANVLVARQVIDKNTSGDVIASDQLYRTESVRHDELQDGAFTDPDQLRGQLATKQIFPGQQLTSGDFTGGADPITGELTGTDRGLALTLDTQHGDIGQISAGSRVDVLGGATAQQTGSSATGALGVLARDALVLDVSTDTTGGGVGSGDEHKVVLRVSDVEATRIAAVQEGGNVWLVVRPPTNAKDSQISAVQFPGTLGSGG